MIPGLVIRLKQAHETIPLALLLEADPDEQKIREYVATGPLILAIYRNEPVGVCVLEYGPDWAEIKNIAVRAAHRKKGLGRTLLAFAEKETARLGKSRLRVGTGNSSLQALALYRAAGFEQIGQEKDFFVKNYALPIFENGIQCRDLLIFEKPIQADQPTMEEIVIRKATPDDAALIALLGRTTFGETFRHYFNRPQDLLDYFEEAFSVAKIKSSLSKPTNVFWLAFVNELPVGYAKLKIDSHNEFIKGSKVSQLQKLYVLKDFLNKKIGSTLQEALFQEVRQINSDVLWLSVFNANARAIRFYEKHGFRRVDTYTFEIGQERFQFLVMEKTDH
ncbi:MAG: GNAT family N-acetyltransferase [Saprospiraceae bacterium]